jgi:MtaA/CmuA family methyltransferase
MNSRELIQAAMRRQPTPRIPVMPQICHDVSVRIFAAEDGWDWIDGVRYCLEQPGGIADYMIRLVRKVGCDGMRLWVKPDPMTIRRQGDALIAIDAATGERLGFIDLHGGGYLVPDRPTPHVETLDDVRRRMDAMIADLHDEKLEILRQRRERVADIFVASSPGSITMNTYANLRGREQAMLDFFEQPDFVLAVMDMQAETMIQRGERLLSTGIDAFMIGDPSASASLISPRHFERFCLPAYQKFCRHFGDRVLIYLHICGNSNPILEMMADSGAHVVEPLDPLGGVSVADAKRRIGQRVGIMGGLNTVTLSQGTPADVRAETIQVCREGGPHGYVLAAGDMVPPDTSLENLQAMVDVATQSQWM